MKHNWDYVKQTTLWEYEELLKKLNKVLAYPLICQTYNHSMPQAKEFARCLFANSDVNSGKFPAPIIATFETLESVGVRDWADLMKKVATRESCISFIGQSRIGFRELIDVLNFGLRWAFPFHTATRELLDPEDQQEQEYYLAFKQQDLMCSFELLERGYTKARRASLAKKTGLPLDFLTRVTHRADIARLPYVRRKTILPVCGAGYDTLAKIAAADLPTMETDMVSYFKRQNRSWDDFKSVIVLRGMVTGAKALPVIMRS